MHSAIYEVESLLGKAAEYIGSIKDYENLLSQKIVQRAQSNIN